MGIHQVGAGHRKLIHAFRNFENAPKNPEHVFLLSLFEYTEPFEGIQALISYSKKKNLLLVVVPIFVVHLYWQADPERNHPRYLTLLLNIAFIIHLKRYSSRDKHTVTCYCSLLDWNLMLRSCVTHTRCYESP